MAILNDSIINGNLKVTGMLYGYAPTAPAGTNDTQIATTAFVTAAISSLAPSAHSHGSINNAGAITSDYPLDVEDDHIVITDKDGNIKRSAITFMTDSEMGEPEISTFALTRNGEWHTFLNSDSSLNVEKLSGTIAVDNLPVASTTQAGIVSTSAQSLIGNKVIFASAFDVCNNTASSSGESNIRVIQAGYSATDTEWWSSGTSRRRLNLFYGSAGQRGLWDSGIGPSNDIEHNILWANNGASYYSSYIVLSNMFDNEINFIGTDATQWFNYRNATTAKEDSTNLVTMYRFGNRNKSTSGVTLMADSFTGNAASSSYIKSTVIYTDTAYATTLSLVHVSESTSANHNAVHATYLLEITQATGTSVQCLLHIAARGKTIYITQEILNRYPASESNTFGDITIKTDSTNTGSSNDDKGNHDIYAIIGVQTFKYVRISLTRISVTIGSGFLTETLANGVTVPDSATSDTVSVYDLKDADTTDGYHLYVHPSSGEISGGYIHFV